MLLLQKVRSFWWNHVITFRFLICFVIRYQFFPCSSHFFHVSILFSLFDNCLAGKAEVFLAMNYNNQFQAQFAQNEEKYQLEANKIRKLNDLLSKLVKISNVNDRSSYIVFKPINSEPWFQFSATSLLNTTLDRATNRKLFFFSKNLKNSLKKQKNSFL